MKNLYLIFTVILTPFFLFAQNYEIDVFDGQTINTCGGTFYDSGGQFGAYLNNENYTVTFCSSTPGQAIQIDFTTFTLSPNDILCVYDGTTSTAPNLGCFSSVMPATTVVTTAANTGGCMTLQWISSPNGIAAGWAGNISCVTPCQPVEATLASANPAPVPLQNGFIDICPGTPVVFNGQGTYPQNNTNYTQSDATSSFLWTVEGVQYTTQNITHTFNQPGGYRVQLEVTDVNGCKSTNILDQKVRVSADPIFDGTTASANTICIGDTVTLNGFVTPQEEDFATPISEGGTFYLPDVVSTNGTCYTGTLSVNDFIPGQTISSINDILSVCVNMEHSYMGDLSIELICPNGTSVQFHNQAGGGTYLGVPVINPDGVPGTGWDYCWATGAPNSTWAVVSGGVQTLPAGTYTPNQSFAGFVGCPLNGDWTLRICDFLPVDDGFVFEWSINFDPSLYPSLDPFTPTIAATDKQWLPNPSIINNVGDTTITIVPTTPGTASYTFSGTNEFGCTYDTTINITVLPFTDPACIECDSILFQQPQNDETICLGSSVGLDATFNSNLDDVTFTHISGATIPTGSFLDADLNVIGVQPLLVNANSIESVCVNIDHEFVGDVTMYLVAPNGQQILLSDANGGFADDYTNTCFSPSATQPITNFSPPFTGTFLPQQGNWTNVTNVPANGIWKLRVTDNQPGGDGTLLNWSITFTNPHNITYNWTPATGLSCTNCPDPTANPDTTTTYIINLSDNYGCTTADTIVVNVIQPLSAPVAQCANVTGTNITASWGAVTGAVGYQVNINGTGWISPNGSLSHGLSGLQPSTTVQIEVRAIDGICNANGEIDTISCTTLPCVMVAQLDSTIDVSCFGGSDGQAFISSTGGQLPISYQLTGITQNNTGVFTGLSIGSYEVVIQDALGCLDTVDFNIGEPTDITLVANKEDVLCFGGSDGEVNVVASGGIAPYTYSWNTSPAQSTDTVRGLPIGTYTVTVTDANNCTATASVTINQPAVLQTAMSKIDVTCFGGTDGTATVNVAGGVTPYSFLWEADAGNQITSTATNLATGTYTVTVTDDNNCTIVDSVTVNQPDEILFNATTQDLICHVSTQLNGGNAPTDGVIQVAITSGVGPFEYSIDCGANWQTSNLFTGLAPLTYQVTVRNLNGTCQTACVPVTINQPDSIDLSFTTNQVTCFGLSDGDATVIPTGGTGGYTYNWNTSPAQNTPTSINLPGGDFIVTVTDANNCYVVDTVNVFAPVLVNMDTIYSTPTLCYGSNEGTVNTQGSGGTGVLTYFWNTPATASSPNAQTVTNLFTGVYSTTITDEQGCKVVDSILVQQPDSLELSFTTTSLFCFEDSSGTATVSTIGGTAPYTYVWSNTQMGTTATNLPSGFVTVTVTDANNCTNVDSVFVSQPPPLSLITSSTQVTCNGDGDGTATITPSGGVGGYTYLWNDMQTDSTAIGLNGGWHFVTLTDANNCTLEDSVFVLERPALVVTDTFRQVSCTGFGDGTATITTIGGTGNYTYQWDNGQDSITAINLAGGTYFYTVTDSDNCTISDSVTVYEPPVLTSTISGTNISCNGGLDGTASVVAIGGSPPYAYTWENNPQVNPNVFGLAAGWTSVTIVDAYGCIRIDSVLLTEPAPLETSTIETPVICFGDSTGNAITTPMGGTAPYTYQWSFNNDMDSILNDVPIGTYIVTITDDNDCALNDTITVTEPPLLTIDLDSTWVTCFGASDGGVSVNPSGGFGTYSYQWSSAAKDTFAFVNNIPSGTYTVTVTDANGCFSIDSIFVPQPTEIQLSLRFTPTTCFGFSDGTATVTATGGTPSVNGYTYAWENSTMNDSTYTGLVAGMYSVTVTDGNGCLAVDSIMVQEPAPITLNFSQTPASCFGFSDAEGYVMASGGNGGYSYTWGTSPIQTGDTAYALLGGATYTVGVVDTLGCIGSDSITIIQPNELEVSVSGTDISCFEGNDGTTTITPLGGTTPYTYQWDAAANNQITATATNLVAGTYFVTLTDGNNCFTSTSITLTEPTPLSLTTDQSNILCFGEATGVATVQGSGGTPNYSYAWMTNTGVQINDTAIGLIAGTYQVTVTDAFNCTITDSVTITQPDAPLSSTVVTEDVTCFGDFDGRITVTSVGGTPNYLYQLEDNNQTTNNVFVGLNAGNYLVRIQDALGCRDSVTASISQLPAIEIDAGNDALIDFPSDYQINTTVTNGTAPFVYVWTPVDTFLSCSDCPNPLVQALNQDKFYTVLVTDADGCTAEDALWIRVKKLREVFVANAFTPNGDNVNDWLFVQGSTQVAKVRSFRIFDRWGEMVHEVADVDVNDALTGGWDGTFNGKPMNPGTFAWSAEIEFIDGEVKIYTGDALLIR